MMRVGAKPPACSGVLYTVRRGDTMYKIAKRFGISLGEMIKANPQVKNPNRILPGQELCVPAGTGTTPDGGTAAPGGGTTGPGDGTTSPGSEFGDGFIEPTQPGVG